MKTEENVKAVVVGLSDLSYEAVCLASLYIQAGAAFIGTNPDRFAGGFPIEGAIVSGLEAACGRKADLLAGKPNAKVYSILHKDLGLQAFSKTDILFIGDNLETDIIFAN